MNRMKNITKAKILLSSSFKTLIVQIAASLCGAFMPLPIAYCTSIVLCVILGLWLLGECDLYAVISSFFLTAISSVAFFFIKTMVTFITSAVANDQFLATGNVFEFAWYLFAVPAMASGYWGAILVWCQEVGKEEKG